MGRTSVATRVKRAISGMIKTRANALESMNPALRKRVGEIEKMLGGQQNENMQFYHRLGQKCLEIRSKPEVYERNAFRKLELALSVESRTLRKAATFADCYTERELEWLLNLKHESLSYRIHWGHMTYLLTVSDKSMRRRLAESAVKELWDPPTLHQAIKKELGVRRAGGRPHRLPATVAAQVKQILSLTRMWLTKQANLWCGEDTNVFTNVLTTPPDRYTTSMLEDLQGVVTSLQELQEKLPEMIALAERTRDHVSTALARADQAAAEAARVDPTEAEHGRPSRQIRASANGVRRRAAAAAPVA